MSDKKLLRETLSWINSIPNETDDHHSANDRNNDCNSYNSFVISNPSNYFYNMRSNMNNVDFGTDHRNNNSFSNDIVNHKFIDKHYWLKRLIYNTLRKAITREQYLCRVYYYTLDKLQLKAYNYFHKWYMRYKIHYIINKKIRHNTINNKIIINIRNEHRHIQKYQHIERNQLSNQLHNTYYIEDHNGNHNNNNSSHYGIILTYHYKLHNYILFWYYNLKHIKNIKRKYWRAMIMLYRGCCLLKKVTYNLLLIIITIFTTIVVNSDDDDEYETEVGNGYDDVDDSSDGDDDIVTTD